MTTLQCCSKQQRRQHLPSQQNSLQVYSRHEECTSARPSSLLDFLPETGTRPLPFPTYFALLAALRLLSIFLPMTTRKYLCATHYFALLARLAHSVDLSQLSQHCSNFWFYSTLYIKYSSQDNPPKSPFFHLYGKVTKDKY